MEIVLGKICETRHLPGRTHSKSNLIQRNKVQFQLSRGYYAITIYSLYSVSLYLCKNPTIHNKIFCVSELSRLWTVLTL